MIYGKARKIEFVKTTMPRRKLEVDGLDIAEMRIMEVHKGYMVDV